MTSRVSFYKLYKETLKRHLASTLIVLLTFVIHFITMLMQMQNIAENADSFYADYQFDRMMDIFSPSIINGVIALAIGAFLSYDYFRYMHSRKQTDFYESLPLRRQEHFLLNFVCSISVFAVISAITLCLEYLVANILGLGNSLLFSSSLWNYVCMILSFLVSWVTASLAMILTGNSIIALLGYGVFTIYFPVLINNLVPTFSEMYYDTFLVMPTYTKLSLSSLINYLSPASLMYKLVYFRYDYWKYSDHSRFLIIAILFILIIGLISYKLHKNRPSESAGRAMAYEKANSIIRILIVIPLALYGGILFKQLSVNESNTWQAFGIIFVGFIVHGILQAIFDFDVRSIFSKKRQLLLTYVFCFGFVAFFLFDLSNFDDYVPDASKVKNVYIYVDNVMGYSEEDNHNGLSKENVLVALEAAKEITALDDNFNENELDNVDSIIFKYELNNGKIISREYLFRLDQIPNDLNELSAQADFKDDLCILYNHDPNYFTSMFYYEFYDEVHIPIDYQQKLIATYLDEYTKFSLTDHYNTPVVFTFGVNYRANDEEYEHHASFFVYESFKETIALLNEIGCQTIADNEDITIKTLEVYDEKYENGLIIDDAKILERLKPYLYSIEYNYYDRQNDWRHCSACIQTATDEIYYDVAIRDSDLQKIIK